MTILKNSTLIRRVPKDEEKPQQEWLLPHFPVIRPERASTKVRIVFDGSVPYEGKSLNTEALPGPKLQSNVFDILVKLRKETVALAGDISQMYHQLVLREEDRPLHRFCMEELRSIQRARSIQISEIRFRRMLLSFPCTIYLAETRTRS